MTHGLPTLASATGLDLADAPATIRASTDERHCTRETLTQLELHQLWRETDRRLDSLIGSVCEIKRVDEASTFSRWLQFTGLLDILERNSNGMPLPVDGQGLRRKAKELASMCGDLYRQGKANPQYAQSDIAAINRKLDIIAAHVATVMPVNCEDAFLVSRLADGRPATGLGLDSETRDKGSAAHTRGVAAPCAA